MTLPAKAPAAKAAKPSSRVRAVPQSIVPAVTDMATGRTKGKATPRPAKQGMDMRQRLTEPWTIFLDAYAASPTKKITEIKRGIPAHRVRDLAIQMDLPQTVLIDYLGLARSSVHHKATAGKMLAKDESELVLGVESLIGQVETMVAESGDPAGFDPAKWVARWLASANPVLGGQAPASLMDTVEGQKLVASILLMAQTGAYA
ncbi:hypothetical protein RCH09_003615 [Actimicrobium sp. GrIS 1.19]|nr:hypothetical protein [Actimicrobium sp. GrIS 1.19]